MNKEIDLAFTSFSCILILFTEMEKMLKTPLPKGMTNSEQHLSELKNIIEI